MGYIGRFVIVVTGSFNPGILHPDWFEKHALLSSDELSGLYQKPKRVEIPQVGVLEYGQSFIVEPTRAILNFKSFTIVVDRGRLDVVCESAECFDMAITFLIKFFKLLYHTPVKTYRIVFNEHVVTKENVQDIISKFFSVNDATTSHFSNGDIYFVHKIISQVDGALLKYMIEPSVRLENG